MTLARSSGLVTTCDLEAALDDTVNTTNERYRSLGADCLPPAGCALLDPGFSVLSARSRVLVVFDS